jgi:hypothetical protein
MEVAAQVGGNHYNVGEYQHWDYCSEFHTHPMLYAATKYLVRYRKKNGSQDINKAVSYLLKYNEVTESKSSYHGAAAPPKLRSVLSNADISVTIYSAVQTLLNGYNVPHKDVKLAIRLCERTLEEEYPT